MDGAWDRSAKKSLHPAGENDNLPDDVRDAVGLRDQTKVVGWTSDDPQRQTFFRWDFLVILVDPVLMVLTMIEIFYGIIPVWLCVFQMVLLVSRCVFRQGAVKQQYWVVSESHLHMIKRRGAAIASYCTSGRDARPDPLEVLSVPLAHIVDCGVTESFRVCFISIPCKLFVNTIHETIGTPYKGEYTATNLSHYNEFAQTVLRQRKLVKERTAGPAVSA
jgi:hypothetical protein